MLRRCRNPRRKEFKWYGGRGIKVCRRWLKFENFLADMGIRPAGLTLERLDNNGNYNRRNCVWAPRSSQARNTSRTIRVHFDGQSVSLKELCRILDLPYRALYQRLRRRRHA